MIRKTNHFKIINTSGINPDLLALAFVDDGIPGFNSSMTMFFYLHHKHIY